MSVKTDLKIMMSVKVFRTALALIVVSLFVAIQLPSETLAAPRFIRRTRKLLNRRHLEWTGQ